MHDLQGLNEQKQMMIYLDLKTTARKLIVLFRFQNVEEAKCDCDYNKCIKCLFIIVTFTINTVSKYFSGRNIIDINVFRGPRGLSGKREHLS